MTHLKSWPQLSRIRNLPQIALFDDNSTHCLPVFWHRASHSLTVPPPQNGSSFCHSSKQTSLKGEHKLMTKAFWKPFFPSGMSLPPPPVTLLVIHMFVISISISPEVWLSRGTFSQPTSNIIDNTYQDVICAVSNACTHNTTKPITLIRWKNIKWRKDTTDLSDTSSKSAWS